MDDLISRAYVLAEYDRQHQGPPCGARKIMEEAPAIDAIPVEWLNEMKRLAADYGDRECVDVIEYLFVRWQEEQEAQDDRG